MRSSLLAVLAAVATATSTSTSTFLPADPAHRWQFPQDHFARPGHRSGWWYFTGSLTDAAGRRLGFQLTFFEIGLLPAAPAFDSAWATGEAVMAHLAVTEVATGRHRFAEVLTRATPLLGGFGASPGPAVAWALAPPGTPGRWTLDLEDGTWRLSARDDAAGLALRLTAAPRRPAVLHGPNGYSRKAAAAGYASEYDSQTRLALEGEVVLDGVAAPVRGEGWMDREVGSSLLAPGQVGWDWFALRLADGRDLMLYLLRRGDGAVDWSSGTLVEADGRARPLARGDFSVAATGRWRSPATGAAYPMGWRLVVPSAGLDLTVEPEVREAENRSALLPGLSYWEGPVLVRQGGRAAGQGYVELTGYGEGRLPL